MSSSGAVTLADTPAQIQPEELRGRNLQFVTFPGSLPAGIALRSKIRSRPPYY
jgi:hypothetical protein